MRYNLCLIKYICLYYSAGVGRTGTFIGLYNLMNELADPEKNEIDVFYAVFRMRWHRTFMVQTQVSYIYIYIVQKFV